MNCAIEYAQRMNSQDKRIISYIRLMQGEYGDDLLQNISDIDAFCATDGKIIPITWEKQTDKQATKYYTADGQQLKMNPGKTWITIFKDTEKSGIIVE